ncbi:hypothetical protein M3Y97_01133200 [Aphelenchoides bicaudatus]|nr:hypothetical protein M3Y97_01133200 [Aphelenchoides bicaudatus]
MLPMLFVQLSLMIASTFIELFCVVHTVYYFVWTQINEVSAKNDWHNVIRGRNYIIVIGLFIFINVIFGFWLPLQRFMAIQQDKKSSLKEEKTAFKTFV